MKKSLFGLRELAPALFDLRPRIRAANRPNESGSTLPHSKESSLFAKAIFGAFAAVCALLPLGCGFIADKDRIVVAKLDGKNITRGELDKYIHDMPDEERPLIQNKADLLDTLNAWINDQVKAKLADQLHQQGKIDVSRDVARERYFEKHPEFRMALQIQDPTQLEMSKGDLTAIQAEIEFGTDEEVDRLMREEALKYNVYEAIQNKTIQITPEDVKREYDRRKDELIKFEYLEFIALQFPLAMPDAIARAADARRRIDAGEKFDDVLRPYLEANAQFGVPGALENNPAIERFRSFWEAAAGASVGQVIGPVFMPEHEEYKLDPQTQKPVKRLRPAAQLVLEVTQHEPERIKTFEEAANELATGIAKQRVLEQVRADHGVEVYDEKLRDPAGVGDQYKRFMIDTGKPAPANFGLPQ